MAKFRVLLMCILVLAFLSAFYVNCFEDSSTINNLLRYAEDDFLKSWQVLSPKPVGDDLFSVHFAGNAVVASLFGGKILYSDNAMMTFEYYNLPHSDILNEITDYSNNYVGVSSQGKMYKSLTGKSWSEVTGEVLNKPLTAVAAGNKVIAVGLSGLIISSDNLSSYSKRTTGIQSNLYDIAVSDSNTYVAVGQNAIVCRSSDGTAFTCSTTTAGADIVGIAYGNNKFIAVTANNRFMVSTDNGANWTISDLGFSGVISGIEYFNDEFVIYGLDGFVATSNTGNSFQKLNVNSAFDFYDMTYDGSLYYFVGPGGLILTSSHPSLGFIKASPDIAGDLFAIYKGRDYFVVGGSGGTVAYSNDGLNFTPVDQTEIGNDIKAISSDKNPSNERFCAVADGGFVYWSNDVSGEWSGYHLAGNYEFNDIVFAVSRFILAGDGGNLYMSGDCINFLKINTGSTADFNRILFDGTNIVVAGSGGTLYRSNNPSGPYSKLSFPAAYDIVDMAYGNGMYLFLTQEKIGDSVYNSRIYKSIDLSSFTLVKEYSNIKLTRVAFGAGYFIFTSGQGTVYYTKDGQNFLLVSTGKYKEILNAAFLERAFYLSGIDGLLLKSGDNMAGLEPQISVSRSSINFSDTVINSSSDIEDIVVGNIGKGNLFISAVLITGVNANQFMIVSDSCSTSTLSNGDECRIYVDFRPTSTGSKTAKLDISSNDKSYPTYSVNLTGKGITPTHGAISTDKQSIDFGIVKLGMESQVQSVTVKNVGTKNLAITGVAIGGSDTSDFEIKSENCEGKSLTSNSTCTIGISFKPLSLGRKHAELLIDSDDPIRPTARILLSGNGIDINYPNIVVDKNQIDFGVVKVGAESDPQSLVVSNSGSTFLVVSEVNVEGTNVSDFIIKSDECKGKTLTPASSCKIDLAFRPQNAGNLSATLKISSNDPHTPIYSINLYGVGRAAGGPAINITPTSLNFGKVNTGTESAAQDIIVSSVGDTDLTITSQSITGNDNQSFKVVGVSCPLKIAPGQSCKISVVFIPKSSGVKNAVLQISSNDPLFPQVNVTLVGEGILNKPSEISVTPSSYDFGNRIIGKVYPPTTFTVKNEGIGNLIIDSVVIEGEYTDVFKIEADECSGNQFAPDGLCHIKVNFTPTQEMTYSVNLVINSNDSTTPKLEVPLKGIGIERATKDVGIIEDVIFGEDTGPQPLSDTKSKDESTSGCGCSIVE